MLVKSQSKRLPQKNVKEFKGKPMFLHNLEKCKEIFGEVYVSSDSKEILKMAEEHGAIGISRPEELCGDTPDIPVFQHALETMDRRDPIIAHDYGILGDQVEGIVAVHANNPNIEEEVIETVKNILEQDVPEVMTCTTIERADEYKDQHSKINGSVRGISRKRLEHYGDPYAPSPEVWVVDGSLEIETQEDFDKASCQ